MAQEFQGSDAEDVYCPHDMTVPNFSNIIPRVWVFGGQYTLTIPSVQVAHMTVTGPQHHAT